MTGAEFKKKLVKITLLLIVTIVVLCIGYMKIVNLFQFELA